jgi:ubiquinone/menaquinone biosynthesis C-methylase UbiE
MRSSRTVVCFVVFLSISCIASRSLIGLADEPTDGGRAFGNEPDGTAVLDRKPVPDAKPVLDDKPVPDDKPASDGKPVESKVPPPRTHYMGREIAQTMHFDGAPWLIRDSRERQEDCSTLMEVLDVKAGQTICDMGCGNGFYTLKLANMVGAKGRVVAVDIQREMLLLLEERAKAEKLTNIEGILGDFHDPNLKGSEIDLILCVDVYHEFSHPVHMLQKMRAALAPKGRIALVEFRAEDPKVPIKKLHKMSKEQILKEWEPNGFKLVEEYDKLPWQHVMFFERDEEQERENRNR